MASKIVALLLMVFCASAFDYTQSHVVACSQTPTSTYLENLEYLWSKAILHNIDRYVFLIVCPFVLFLQLIIIYIFLRNRQLLRKPGNIFFAIVLFQIFINIHYITTAIYYTVEDANGPMPASFPDFCSTNSIIMSFIDFLHMEFLVLFPFYIIYVLRFTLKTKTKIWKIIYVTTIVFALTVTYVFWYFDFLGLNIYGLCGVTFIRQPAVKIYVPAFTLVSVIVFFSVGFFTIKYFKKHMPNSIGLRKKKFQQNALLFYYVIGFSAYLLVYFIITIIELVNCTYDNPSPALLPLVTVFNLVRLTQFIYMFLVIFKNRMFMMSFKKFWKRLFSKRKVHDQQIENSDKTKSFYKDQDFQLNFQQFFLDIKQQKNQIDILKISQIVTIVSGIYVAYKQYYNIKDEYFNSFVLASPENKSVYSNQSRYNGRKVRKIYYHQKMSVLIDAQIIKDYVIDLSLIPRLGILQCTMTIHAPKIFQLLLENDRLQNIFQSFELHENTKKMFDLVEGQGGRSGQFFFFSYDNKYVLKTITQQQFQFIEENLYFFHQHYRRNPQSILAKIYGLFTFKGNQIQRTYHLILMKNILGCTKDKIIRTYDLKGSKYDREVANDMMINQLEKYTLKDVDFMKMETKIIIQNDYKKKLREVIQKDSIFLRNLNLIDYSFLVVKVKWEVEPKNPDFWSFFQRIKSSNSNQIHYHLGIIDYLQRWDLQKKGQKWWKNLMGKKDISAQEPKKYQQRFMSFISQITEQVSHKDQELQMKNFEKQKLSYEIIEENSGDRTFVDDRQLQNFCLQPHQNESNITEKERQAMVNEQVVRIKQGSAIDEKNLKQIKLSKFRSEQKLQDGDIKYQIKINYADKKSGNIKKQEIILEKEEQNN